MNAGICCDTCPYIPTCEEENQFLADIGLAGQWGEEPDDYDSGVDDYGYCMTPGCNCCDGDDDTWT